MNRRHLLSASALASLSGASLGDTQITSPKGKAEHWILIWLGGGMSQIDTFLPLSAPIQRRLQSPPAKSKFLALNE
ncbi:MAG: hypothetical protein ACI9MB_001205 [Verrucomicrobiales bacterium]|jgi:hypothetical protein